MNSMSNHVSNLYKGALSSPVRFSESARAAYTLAASSAGSVLCVVVRMDGFLCVSESLPLSLFPVQLRSQLGHKSSFIWTHLPRLVWPAALQRLMSHKADQSRIRAFLLLAALLTFYLLCINGLFVCERMHTNNIFFCSSFHRRRSVQSFQYSVV